MPVLRPALTLALALIVALPSAVQANQESARLRVRAFQMAYNLDYEAATREMTAATAADPRDAAAERGLAVIPWLMIAFSRGSVTVDDYLGSVSRQNVALRQPPADLAARFTRHIARAQQLAQTTADASPRDPNALYELGAVIALQASYTATVEGKILGAFRSARRAYDLHEQVLAIDPSRTDAALTVGMYRYLVSQMSLPVRMMAYVAGFGGGKDEGLQMVESAAAASSEAQADARFALVLLYNREHRYGDALRVLAELQRSFARNRILWLEAGATALRAGRPADAERQLSVGLAMLASDTRPRAFGEQALWLQKHGAALVALNRPGEGEVALKRALSLESLGWVTGRVDAELGKIADLRGDRVTARGYFVQAAALAKSHDDSIGLADADRWIDARYARK